MYVGSGLSICETAETSVKLRRYVGNGQTMLENDRNI